MNSQKATFFTPLLSIIGLIGIVAIVVLVAIFLAPFWSIFWGILALQREAFQALYALPYRLEAAILVVFMASVSEAIGQSFVLFVNRVPPSRFLISLLVTAIFYVFNYGVWAASIWIINSFIFAGSARLLDVASTLGFGYAPFILGFAIALPYAGETLYGLLTIWSVLAIATGLTVLTGTGFLQALSACGLGFLLLLILQRTLGYPLIFAVHWLSEKLLGFELFIDKQHLRPLLESSPNLRPIEKSQIGVAEAINSTPENSDSDSRWQQYFSRMSLFVAPLNQRMVSVINRHKWAEMRKFKRVLKYVCLAFLAIAVLILISPAKGPLLAWHLALDDVTRLVLDLVGFSLLLVFLALFVEAFTSPIEALGWWAGWYAAVPVFAEESWQQLAPPQSQVKRYVVFLDGICQDSTHLKPYAQSLLRELYESLPPEIRIVGNIMPYSATNRPLTASDRPLAWFWQWVENHEQSNRAIANLINLRNLFKIVVSADDRYGPIYNQGSAQTILTALLHNDYPLEQPLPLTFIGYSGGAQVSLGAISYLQHLLQVPIDMISLGGVFSGNVRFPELRQMYHLVGEKDTVEPIGRRIFPARWPIVYQSPWNQARRQGKVHLISLGPTHHNGKMGYVDGESLLPDGRTCRQQTVEVLASIIRSELEAKAE